MTVPVSPPDLVAVGLGSQATALGLGSVLLVQALLVTALLFAPPINARATAGRQALGLVPCWRPSR